MGGNAPDWIRSIAVGPVSNQTVAMLRPHTRGSDARLFSLRVVCTTANDGPSVARASVSAPSCTFMWRPREREASLEVSQPDLEHEALPQDPRVVTGATHVLPEACLDGGHL